MKIYLSQNTVDYIRKNDCDIASAFDKEEAAIMEKALEELSRRGEDHKFDLSPEVFEFVLSNLDWYCSAYGDEQG